MVKVNIHQHQKGKPNLSKKIFGPEATLIQWGTYIKKRIKQLMLDHFDQKLG